MERGSPNQDGSDNGCRQHRPGGDLILSMPGLTEGEAREDKKRRIKGRWGYGENLDQDNRNKKFYQTPPTTNLQYKQNLKGKENTCKKEKRFSDIQEGLNYKKHRATKKGTKCPL